MKTNLTRAEVGQKMAAILREFYTNSKMDITIGLTAEGLVDYAFDVHGTSTIEVVFYRTNGGWTLDNESDTNDPEFWIEDVLDWIGEVLTDPRNDLFDLDGNWISVEYA